MTDYEDNLYETEMTSYSLKQETARELPPPPPGERQMKVIVSEQPSIPDHPKKSSGIGWKIAALVVATLMLGMLVVLLVQVNFNSTKQSTALEEIQAQYSGKDELDSAVSTTVDMPTTTVDMPTTTPLGDAQSCLELRNRGEVVDGLYSVKPRDEFAQFQAYCDMTTDGGGWTLVASVHEKDIKRKCDPDDMWSAYVPLEGSNFAGKTNWENEMTFGKVQTSTKADYKNLGYFSLNASDVMVWHVPHDVALSLLKERSTFRYRTKNKFLQKRGGNLGSIYGESNPLSVSTGVQQTYRDRTKKVLDALSAKSTAIKTAIPNFYGYGYSSSYSNSIPYSAMYRRNIYGNRVTFGTSTFVKGDVDYETDVRCADNVTIFSSKKSTPFFAAAAVSNLKRKTQFYYIQIYNYRPYYYNYYGETTLENSTITKGNLKLHYQLLQYRYSTQVTIGEFHFVISSPQDWGSIQPSKFSRTYSYTSGYYRKTRFQIDGSPVNVIMGYTLLARSSGKEITQDMANQVAEKIIDAVSELKTLFREEFPSLSTPVVFDKGDTDEMLQMVPPDVRASVQPGHLQFRVYNALGYPSAFCPGLKITNPGPSEYLCIGGVSDDIGQHGTCGDFAGWDGLAGDIVQSNRPSGMAHSHKDIFSTILIFLR